MTPNVATHPATRMVNAASRQDQGWTKEKTAYRIRVLVDDGCLDMDIKSNICPYYVQGMSNLCLGTGSVQFLSPLGQNSVNPPQISHEGGQRLDLKIQSLSRYCPKNL